jgi:DNA polymerase-4
MERVILHSDLNSFYASVECLYNPDIREKPIRSIGVRVTDLVTADTYTQLSLFDDESKRLKLEQLECSVDDIRRRFGHYSVQRAVLLTDSKLNSNPIEENIIFPVSYFRQ